VASLTVYGIPNCDTVKKARRWLQAHDAAHDFVDYRADPPDAERVAAWVEALGSKALRNTSGGAYRKLPADKKTWSDTRWVEAFAAEPMLIKRPVIERDGVAVKVGFRGTDEELSAQLL
jgi:arsenate reductase